ncbi:pantothenate synthetase [Desulfacinum hydrothermale DSM 13146]|uniref:Pantothenate synthetase n=1 Tax=Desulfacinum hydrothermale DSM 13146 TaxID=1121390 RepID=A0A1W1XL44_9BACT|nr:pantoate--beta-alanine ligase [Desulfacinum hydrothermale]SMC24261.1 pantothenate synthetase [Desulfacinum hydrothermale DSM 13146]
MRVIDTLAEMQQQADQWRREGLRIGFVPTMGYFHEGHLALMRHARTLADKTVISIFVNPTQFGPNEDFEAYPRDMDRDLELARGVGVDVVFAPTVDQMYPPGFQTYVQVEEVTRPLCGRSRPGHFRGVATVVAKLFQVVKPHVAVFGQKDYQQLLTIRRMVEDLAMDVQVVGHPIVREADGLAMSSRNTYLSEEDRRDALLLSRSLEEARRLVSKGERNGEVILGAVRRILASGPRVRIDYAELRDAETLEPVQHLEGPTLLALAAHVGRARLIDNTVLEP